MLAGVVDGVVDGSCRVSGRRRVSCFRTSCSESVLWSPNCLLLQAYSDLRSVATVLSFGFHVYFLSLIKLFASLWVGFAMSS
jgi:hypothetical protein